VDYLGVNGISFGNNDQDQGDAGTQNEATRRVLPDRDWELA